jgi:hypothetical protein
LGFNGFIWILKLFYELNLTGIYMDSWTLTREWMGINSAARI